MQPLGHATLSHGSLKVIFLGFYGSIRKFIMHTSLVVCTSAREFCVWVLLGQQAAGSFKIEHLFFFFFIFRFFLGEFNFCSVVSAKVPLEGIAKDVRLGCLDASAAVQAGDTL